jgi:mycothiol synthase
MSSLPEGITSRPMTRDDAALVAELVAEEEAALGREPRMGAADVLAFWVRTDLAANSWLLEDAGGIVATGWMEAHGDTAFTGSTVHPRAQGRGIGAALVARAEGRARELGASRLLQFSFGEDSAAHELFESQGYHPVRRHYEMAIELDGEPPEPELPKGLVLETFREEEAKEFHDATVEAFADEWGFISMPFDEWWKMRQDEDKSLWFVVRDGDRIAAYARCEAGRHGGGFVGMIGTRKAWRRKGLGQALLLHAFREFWARGIRRVSLGVDSENPTGATRLYERVGMHVESEDVTFEKELG